jgi:hypothetical protein
MIFLVDDAISLSEIYWRADSLIALSTALIPLIILSAYLSQTLPQHSGSLIYCGTDD